MKFGRKLTSPDLKNYNFPSAVKLVAILLMISYQENPLVQAILTWKSVKLIDISLSIPPYLCRDRSQESLFQIWRKTALPKAKKMTTFPQLSNWQSYCQWYHWENPLNYNFFTHQYWLCDIVSLTQNHHGKGIITLGPEYKRKQNETCLS